jgi:hypothetical protein
MFALIFVFMTLGKGLIQKAGVQYILDSVVQALLQDPTKRFIYVESGIMKHIHHHVMRTTTTTTPFLFSPQHFSINGGMSRMIN